MASVALSEQSGDEHASSFGAYRAAVAGSTENVPSRDRRAPWPPSLGPEVVHGFGSTGVPDRGRCPLQCKCRQTQKSLDGARR